MVWWMGGSTGNSCLFEKCTKNERPVRKCENGESSLSRLRFAVRLLPYLGWIIRRSSYILKLWSFVGVEPSHSGTSFMNLFEWASGIHMFLSFCSCEVKSRK